MKIIYEQKDIVDQIDIKELNIMDAVGISLDSIELILNNTINEWSGWKPAKKHSLNIMYEGFKSGIHYIDDIVQNKSKIVLKALPIHPELKQPNTKAWNDIRLLELLGEFATKYGLSLKTYEIENQHYKRVEQVAISDVKFLLERCMLEGYILKITDGNLVVFNEKIFESKGPISIRYDESISDFKYHDKSTDIYGGATLKWGDIDYSCKSSCDGSMLDINSIQVSSIGEAERFSKNILRNYNKYEKTLVIYKSLDMGKAAGNVVNVEGFGLCDGLYFIYQVTHKLSNNSSVLRLRKI